MSCILMILNCLFHQLLIHIHVYLKKEATYLRNNGEIPQVDKDKVLEEFFEKKQNNFKAYHLQDFLKERY